MSCETICSGISWTTLHSVWQRGKKTKAGRLVFSSLVEKLAILTLFQEIEATLHCIMSVQEAMDLEKTPHLGRLFSPDILGRLPSTGHSRIRRTTLSVIGGSPSLC
jgi:hypothetical protein